MPSSARSSQSTREFTYVCLDCGALGVAGGYHDHGGGAAGETIPLKELPKVIRSFQMIENERDELRDEIDRLEHDLATSRIGPWMEGGNV